MATVTFIFMCIHTDTQKTQHKQGNEKSLVHTDRNVQAYTFTATMAASKRKTCHTKMLIVYAIGHHTQFVVILLFFFSFCLSRLGFTSIAFDCLCFPILRYISPSV